MRGLKIEGYVGQDKRQFVEDYWPKLYDAMASRESIQVTATGVETDKDKRDSLVVAFGMIKGIIPPEEIGKYKGTTSNFIGQPIYCKVKHCDRAKNIVHLSRKDAIEEIASKTWEWIESNCEEIIEISEERKAIIKSYKEVAKDSAEAMDLRARIRDNQQRAYQSGPVTMGVVRFVSPAGATVDIGGVKAFLPVKEATWGTQKNARALLNVGDALDIKIIGVDLDAKQVTISSRILQPDPWEYAADKYKQGGLYLATIAWVNEDYLIVELEPGITLRAYRPEQQEFRVGQSVQVKLIFLNIERRSGKVAISRVRNRAV